jgi:cellulose synthase/poly-beta-1,6-N-acetylglucosamine synthase-like glycosyltransferase
MQMITIFWICAFLVLYVYLGYPLLLASGLLGKRKLARCGCIHPALSVLIPAHNEEKIIRAKLLNLLSQNYPLEKVQILVGNDGSSDNTASIVSEFLEFGVHLVKAEQPRGKSSIQNALVNLAHGEILVFTDADCMLPRNALRDIVQHFADPNVGLVTGCATFSNQEETPTVEGEGLYWKYERWLRQQESDRGLLAMASGSLFAMRSLLWRRLDPNMGDDFVLPLHVAKSGFRNVLENRFSTVTVLTQNRPDTMFKMKKRIVSKDLRGLLANAACLNPLRVGLVAIALWSHKLLRWAVPYFLIGLLLTNCFLLSRPFYALIFLAQLAFYAISVIGLLLGEKRVRFPFSTASSFCVVNLAALLGTLHCFSFQPAGQWKPVR